MKASAAYVSCGHARITRLYSRPTADPRAFCIDPIEKKPLNHFLPGTPVLSFGTAGCNLTCKFCQNWEISKAKTFDRVQDLASPEAIAEAAHRSGCRSVAFTYNDPVIFLEYAVDVAQACREKGIKTVAVSAGYISPEPRAEFFRYMDAANIDLKGFSEGFYKTLCSGKLGAVLETLEYIKRDTNVWLEITTLLIPGENDSAAEIEAESAWLRDCLGPDVPLHFTAYHPDWKLTDNPPTPPQTLHKARKIALKAGLDYVYTGNVHDPDGQTTYCHACGTALIGRDWYEITKWHMSEHGRCAGCGASCPGVFEGEPGQWGARRQPIKFLSPPTEEATPRSFDW
jgi:pyruvate formate lyase activating enzyme